MTHQVKRCFGHDPVIMGIVNVTPDSFSDGGKFINKNNAVEHGVNLLKEGAQILDIGGESTRPGAEVVDIEEEIFRVIPVIRELRKYTKHISIDTRNARTMRAALEAGATAVNDISALSYDSESINVIKEAQVPVFLMHMRGTPQSMTKKTNYNNIVDDIYQYLDSRIHACKTAGIDSKKIFIDLGIGFAKTAEQNALLLKNIKKFQGLGCEMLLGTSRKRFIAALSHGEPSSERLGGSLASVIWARSQGVKMFRVHDVKETAQALKIYDAISFAS